MHYGVMLKMDKAEFSVLLYAATRIARDFARQFTKTKLYDEFLYHLELNESCEKTEDDQVVYPEDNFKWLRGLSHNEVVDLLWRDERVPIWINIKVVYSEKKVTHIGLLCCGRYVKDVKKLLYRWNGTAPFGVKSPHLKGYYDGFKMKLKKSYYETDTIRIMNTKRDIHNDQEA